VPIELIFNTEEQIEGEEQDWNYDSSDEEYIYDEDSDGHIVKRTRTYPRFKINTEVPHFALNIREHFQTSQKKSCNVRS
jgi:hypothetical protein